MAIGAESQSGSEKSCWGVGMRCEECDKNMKPFNFCTRFKWRIDDGKTKITGCNIDGKLPPREASPC